jgi:hypothetical protein
MGSERLGGVSLKVMWEKLGTSTFSHHPQSEEAEFDPALLTEALAG